MKEYTATAEYIMRNGPGAIKSELIRLQKELDQARTWNSEMQERIEDLLGELEAAR